MTRDDYRKAVGSLEPDEGLKRRIAAALEQQPRRRVRPLRRALVGTLAAVLVLASLTGIAMAASPEIRRAVLSFFHIDEVEQVPSDAAELGSEPLTGTEIGDRVTAWYIDMDFDGVYFPEKVRLNDDGSVDAFIDWVIDGDTLSTYEYAPEKVSFSVTWRGAEYSGDVYYCVYDGEVTVYDSRDVPWYAASIPGRTDAVLLYVSRGSQADYEQYPFLLQLETGEVEDFLAGTGVDGLELANNYSFSPGNRQLFVTCGDVLLGTRECWYFDFESGALIDAKNLAGEEINTGWFASDGTLLLYKGDDENNTVTYWAYDTGTSKTTLTLDRARVIRDIEENSTDGAIIAGNYAVYVDSERHAEVIDLTTGERRPVEGFAFNDGDSFMANSAGTKLVYYNYEDGWTSLGVLDLISGGFVSFDREAAEGVSEDILSWYDDEYIQIGGTAADGGAVFYLYDVETSDAAQETPGKTTAGTITGTDIGDRVTAWYIDTQSISTYPQPNHANYRDDGSVESIVYWKTEGDTLTQYTAGPYTTEFSLSPYGIDCTCQVSWYADGGECMVYSNGYDESSGIHYYVQAAPEHGNAAILYVETPVGDGKAQETTIPASQTESSPEATPLPVPAGISERANYRVQVYLCSLETGESTALIGKTEAERFVNPLWYAWSPDLSKALIVCDNNGQIETLYFDRGAGAVLKADELTGESDILGTFIDNDTLLLHTNSEEAFSSWVYETGSGELTAVMKNVPIYDARQSGSYGVAASGTRYAVWVENGSISILDLATGEKTPVDGFELPNGARFYPNGDGSRIMYVLFSDSHDAVEELGVIDVGSGEFTVFDRDTAIDVSENGVSWFDDEFVRIYGQKPDGSIYIYLYQIH